MSFETGQRSIDTYNPYQKGTSELRALDATKKNPLARTTIVGGIIALVTLTACETVKDFVDDQPFQPNKEMSRYISNPSQDPPTCARPWFIFKGEAAREVQMVSSSPVPTSGVKRPTKDADKFDPVTGQFTLTTQAFAPNRESVFAIEVLIATGQGSERRIEVGRIRDTIFC